MDRDSAARNSSKFLACNAHTHAVTLEGRSSKQKHTNAPCCRAGERPYCRPARWGPWMTTAAQAQGPCTQSLRHKHSHARTPPRLKLRKFAHNSGPPRTVFFAVKQPDGIVFVVSHNWPKHCGADADGHIILALRMGSIKGMGCIHTHLEETNEHTNEHTPSR